MSTAITQRISPERPDPRPQLAPGKNSNRLRGWRCVECGVARSTDAPSCPVCTGRLAAADFGPKGTVWSSTVVHLDIGAIPAPYVLAYVDLDAGPRFLAHIPSTRARLPVGDRVTVIGVNERGDIQAAPIRTGPEPT